MKSYEQFLKRCQPGPLLDFYNSTRDTQLLQVIISQSWENKLNIYMELKKAGKGFSGPGLFGTTVKQALKTTAAKEKPQKDSKPIQLLKQYLAKREPEDYTFAFLNDAPRPPKNSVYRDEALRFLNEEYVEPLIRQFNDSMEDALTPLPYIVDPLAHPSVNIRRFLHFTKVDDIGRYLILERLVSPEELADREVFYNICYDKYEQNYQAFMSVLSDEDKDKYFAYDGFETREDNRRNFHYNIAPEQLGNNEKSYDQNTPDLKEQYQDSFNWYAAQVYLPEDVLEAPKSPDDIYKSLAT